MRDKASVLVTGGAGFIGSHLIDRLVEAGYAVRVIDNLSTGNLANIEGHLDGGRVDFVEGDIRDAGRVKKSVEGMGMVVHLAAVTSVPFSVEHPGLTYDVNAKGTLNLLRSCAEEGVGRFVFVSSCAVYGEPEFLPLKETHHVSPISPYAASKLAAEHSCLDFYEKRLLKSVILRLFNVYGLRQGLNDYSGVITRFFDRAKRGLPLIVYGDGLQTRDFVNVCDVVKAVLASVENDRALGEVFNIGSGRPISINALAKTVLELVGSDLEVFHEQPRLDEIRDSYADISKAEKLLAYEPSVSLSEGLRGLLSEGVFS